LHDGEIAAFVHPWTAGLGLTATTAVALDTYLFEHEYVPYPNEPSHGRRIGVATVALGLAVLVLVAGFGRWPTAAVDGVYSVVFALGIGRTAYRLYYGIVRPVPPYRLEKASATAR
jgi:hypothetical protein